MDKLNEESWKIYTAFQRYVKTGDKNDIEGIGMDELDFALIQGSRYENDPAFDAMERRLEELKLAENQDFEMQNIRLLPEQQDLLGQLVEASMNVPREHKEKFRCIQVQTGTLIFHPGFSSGNIPANFEDVETLSDESLINLQFTAKGTPNFFVTPLGFDYYKYLKRKGSPAERVEETVQRYLGQEDFRKSYPKSFAKWAEAEKLLWESDSKEKATLIGHLCREGMQEFAAELAEKHQLKSDEIGKKSDVVKRVQATIKKYEEKLGETEKPFLEALLQYWGTVSDLIQRQEHGAEREKEPLVWTDSRRVVFQLAITMFEIHSSLSKLQK